MRNWKLCHSFNTPARQAVRAIIQSRKSGERVTLKGLDMNEIAELEHENRLLRARNERLEFMLNAVVQRLEAACGKNAMPPKLIAEFLKNPDIQVLELQA